MPTIDWRLPQNRRKAFLRFWGLHLATRAHPGMVYSWLPALAEHYGLDDDGRAWLVWLNGNTQNPVTSLLLLEASGGSPRGWEEAVDLVDEQFNALAWDTDRRYQKARFGEATRRYIQSGGLQAYQEWTSRAREGGWEEVWRYSQSQPYMGRLSAWSMMEYARILLPGIPDMGSLLLEDRDGSRSHRNGLCTVMGHDAAYWKWGDLQENGVALEDLRALGEDLLQEMRRLHSQSPDVTRFTLESALCTYKSWHKPNRRYPGVYADMAYERLKAAEARFGERFQVLWDDREENLPRPMRMEANPCDPGLCPLKQNLYRETGTPYGMGWVYDDMMSPEELDVLMGTAPERKEKRWVYHQ